MPELDDLELLLAGAAACQITTAAIVGSHSFMPGSGAVAFPER